MKGIIEQIQRGHEKMRLPFGLVLKETPDKLCIANESFRFFNVFRYKQAGVFRVNRPHDFHEGDEVKIELLYGKIISVKS